jgi:hypothetical protein
MDVILLTTCNTAKGGRLQRNAFVVLPRIDAEDARLSGPA